MSKRSDRRIGGVGIFPASNFFDKIAEKNQYSDNHTVFKQLTIL